MKCIKCGYLTKSRSNNQNSYYWGVVIDLLAQETGNESSDIHEALKIKFLLKRIDIFGNKIASVGSTADLTSLEFDGYIEKIRVWAAEFLKIIIPLPNEY